MGIWFYIFPMLAVIIGGPILLARHKRSGNVWFATQLLALGGLIVSIVLLNNAAFGEIALPMQFAVLTLGALSGIGLSAFIFRR